MKIKGGKVGIAIAHIVVLSYCATTPIPTVTPSATEKAFVTDVCEGENKPASYAWLLWLLIFGHLVFIVYKLYPEFFVFNVSQKPELEDLEDLALPSTISQQLLPVEISENNQVYVRVQPDENEELYNLIEENLPKDLLDEHIDIIYWAVLRQGSFDNKEDRILLSTDIVEIFNQSFEAVEQAFYQLQALGYGKLFVYQGKSAFWVSEIVAISQQMEVV